MTFAREEALAQLAEAGIDLDAPIALGSTTTILKASDEHLARRLAIVLATAEDVKPATRGQTISLATAVEFMRNAGLQGGERTLVTAIARGGLEATFIDGKPRVTTTALADYCARRIDGRS
jgi:hypothetical protein